MRAMWCDRRPVPLNRGARLLLPLCGIVGVWEPAAAAGGAIFTGHIDAFCVSEMMVKMLFFAMVRSSPPRLFRTRVVAAACAAASLNCVLWTMHYVILCSLGSS